MSAKVGRRNVIRLGTAIAGGLFVGNALALPIRSYVLTPYVRGRAIVNAQGEGLVPNSDNDQSQIFQKLLNVASEKDAPIFLPAGVYKIGNLVLPRRTRIIGVPGATRLTYSGRGFMMRAERSDLLHLNGLTFDGLGLRPSDDAKGLVTANTVLDLKVDDCAFQAAGLFGLDLVGCAGVIRDSVFDRMADTAIFSKQANGLLISGNRIKDCGNGGILVHRFSQGDDGTQVINNRIENVRSVNGGTGQWGNGINVFQAHNVMVSSNKIANCAFSSVRANATNNIQILGNHCTGSGETALYGEFTFNGAMVSNNLIEGGTIGISLANFNDGGRLASVTGNIIKNLTNRLPYKNPSDFKPGIGIYAEADTAISGNVIENAPQAGIHIGWGKFCRNVVAANNVVRAVPWGITASVVDGSGPVHIESNILGEISRQAITGFRWIEPATKELLGSRRSGFDHLTLSANRLS